MKSYGNAEMLGLLREVVDITAHGSVWHHKMMLWAHSHGLQGHKRLNRFESNSDRAHLFRLQNYAVDMFGAALEPSRGYDVPAPADIKGYLEAYIDWENGVYTQVSEINGQLIALGSPTEAELVREGLPRKELERVRRMLTEYGLSGWDMSYILPADRELHEKVKKWENEQ